MLVGAGRFELPASASRTLRANRLRYAPLEDIIDGFQIFSKNNEMSNIRITDLHPDDDETIYQTASLLVESFKEHSPDSWPTIEAALTEVRESFGDGRVSRVAIDENGNVLGWIGGIREYRGNVWELHPLAVRPDYQRKGIGRALVADLEKQVKKKGGFTIRLGSDDEDYMTSVSGIDLYPNVLEHLTNIKNKRVTLMSSTRSLVSSSWE